MPRPIVTRLSGLLAILAPVMPAPAAECMLSAASGDMLLEVAPSGLGPASLASGLVAAALALLLTRRFLARRFGRRALMAGLGLALPAGVIGTWASAAVVTVGGEAPAELTVVSVCAGEGPRFELAGLGTGFLAGRDEPLVLPAGREVMIRRLAHHHETSWLTGILGLPRPPLPAVDLRFRLHAGSPGRYSGRCPALCDGGDHASVTFELREPDRFGAWLEQRRQALSGALRERSRGDLMKLGGRVYARRCAACHGSEGQGVRGVFPGLRHNPVVLGPLAPHIRVLLDGRPGTPMKAFRHELSPLEVAAVTTFQRNAWGHDTGDLIQAGLVDALGGAGPEAVTR